VKRINRKKLIENLECLRQGFSSLLDLAVPRLPKSQIRPVAMSAEANHFLCDTLICDLGGESVNRFYRHLNQKTDKLSD